MNYSLLPIMFIISASFCNLSAETKTQEVLQSDNTSQQNSVITIDVPPSVNQDTFLQFLIKNIKSDRVEYKDGKIFIYSTPALASIFLPLFVAIVDLFPCGLAIYGMLKNGFDVILASTFIAFIFLECFTVYALYSEGIKPWTEKNPLITICQDGIKYKDERLIPWNEIKNISQYHGNSYPSLTLTCQREFGSEDLHISSDENLPIAFNAMSELIYQAFCHMKKKQDSSEK